MYLVSSFVCLWPIAYDKARPAVNRNENRMSVKTVQMFPRTFHCAIVQNEARSNNQKHHASIYLAVEGMEDECLQRPVR